MSLLDIEIFNPDSEIIKSEVDDLSVEEEYNSSGNPNDISYLLPSSTKCGEIFARDNTEFTLICDLCQESYDTLKDFGEHYRQQHTIDEEKQEVTEYGETGTYFSDDTREQSFHDVDDFSDVDINEPDPIDNFLQPEVFSCKPCNKQYKNKCSLRRHRRKVHGKNDAAENSQALDEEISKSDVDVSEFCCKICNNVYGTLEDFSKHECHAERNRNTKNKEQRTQKDPETIEAESDSNISKITNPDLYCEICDRQFKYKNIFKKHGMQHATPPIALQKDPEYLKCRYCGIKASDNEEWYQHENSHNELTPYQCSYCPKSFKSRLEVDMHTNSHTGNRPFKCDQCDASFAHSNNLSTHVKRVHLRLTPFSCSVCDRKFLRNVELRIHMRQHTGERPYQCEECGRSFMIAVQLNEHRKKHSNIRDVKCPVCPMAFFTKKMLRKHMVKHSDERPHVCPICGRTFSRKKALVVHSKIHQDFKEYICTICGKAFAQPAGLYSHKKSHMNSFDTT